MVEVSMRYTICKVITLYYLSINIQVIIYSVRSLDFSVSLGPFLCGWALLIYLINTVEHKYINRGLRLEFYYFKVCVLMFYIFINSIMRVKDMQTVPEKELATLFTSSLIQR